MRWQYFLQSLRHPTPATYLIRSYGRENTGDGAAVDSFSAGSLAFAAQSCVVEYCNGLAIKTIAAGQDCRMAFNDWRKRKEEKKRKRKKGEGRVSYPALEGSGAVQLV